MADSCDICDGSGRIVCRQCQNTGVVAAAHGTTECPSCLGSRYHICNNCGGGGDSKLPSNWLFPTLDY